MGTWLKSIDIKQFISRDEDATDEEAHQIGGQIADYLEWHLEEYDEVEEFRQAETQDEVNNALHDLYDWADKERVWLGL